MKKIANFIKKRFAQKKAFSLIELSIVLLIIGIIIAGVTNATSLISKYRLSIARQLTQNAPMNAMTGLMFWLETTAEESFDADIEDGSAIDNWRDINATSNTKYNFTKGVEYSGFSSNDRQPTYNENCINGLPCLSFDGVNDYMDNAVNTSLAAFTIILIVKYDIFAPDRYFFATDEMYIQTSSGQIMNSNIDYYWVTASSSGSIVQSVSAMQSPYMIVYRRKISETNNRINKVERLGTTSGAPVTFGQSTRLTIGTKPWIYPPTFFAGKIGEIIMFDRALTKNETESIEAYLVKKWNIKVN